MNRDYRARLVVYDWPEDKERLVDWLRDIADKLEKAPEEWNHRIIFRISK